MKSNILLVTLASVAALASAAALWDPGWTTLKPDLARPESDRTIAAKQAWAIAELHGLATNTGLKTTIVGGITANVTNNVNLNGTNTIALRAGSLAASAVFGSNLVAKAAPGTLLSVVGYSSLGAAQFVHVYDRASAPTNNAAPVCVFAVPANGNFSLDFAAGGMPMAAGIVVANSLYGPLQTNGAANCFFTVVYR